MLMHQMERHFKKLQEEYAAKIAAEEAAKSGNKNAQKATVHELVPPNKARKAKPRAPQGGEPAKPVTDYFAVLAAELTLSPGKNIAIRPPQELREILDRIQKKYSIPSAKITALICAHLGAKLLIDAERNARS